VEEQEWEIGDFNDPRFWIPEFYFGLKIIIIATGLTFLRMWVQKVANTYAERNLIKQKRKFSESTWKSIFYVFVFIWELWEVYNCNWFPETENCWKGFPNMEPIRFSLEVLYIFQLGFYCHSLYAHFFLEVKREDYWPMLAHHLATIFLIYFSYRIGFARIGLLVLITHDTNDIFLEIGKTLVYMDKKTATNVVFVIMILSWILTRLGIFPFMVIKSVYYEFPKHIPSPAKEQCWWIWFLGALCFLLCLHIWWFSLMLKIVYRIVTGKEKAVKDSRESSHTHSS